MITCASVHTCVCVFVHVCAYICACVCMHLYIMHYRVRGSLVGPEADPGYWQRGEGGRTSGSVRTTYSKESRGIPPRKIEMSDPLTPILWPLQYTVSSLYIGSRCQA